MPPVMKSSVTHFLLGALVFLGVVSTAVSYAHYEYYTYYTFTGNEVCATSYDAFDCYAWWTGHRCTWKYHIKCETVYVQNSHQGSRCQSGWAGSSCTSPICSGCTTGTRCTAPQICTDIDECTTNEHRCQHICINTAGSYKCDCRGGFELHMNGKTCIAEYCRSKTSGCEQNCYSANNSYACSCNAGFRLASNGKSCDDIDECTARLDNCNVMQNFTCENTEGSYRCLCMRGFEQVGPSECRDIDECTVRLDNCSLLKNFTCENTQGSYRCLCMRGFEQVGPNECRGESPQFQGQPDVSGTFETTDSWIIPITVSVVLGVALTIIAVVSVVACARKRKRNTEGEIDLKSRQTTELTYQELSAVTALENTYEAVRKPKKSIDVGLSDKKAADAMQ